MLKNLTKYSIYGILFMILIVLVYYLIDYVKVNKVFKQYGDWLEKKKRNRLLREDDLRKTEGARQKLNFINRLDLMILHSNLNRIFPFLTPEVYITATILASIVTGIVTTYILGFWGIGVASIAVVLFLFYILLFATSAINHQRIEGDMVTFMNLLENYSKTSDDILKIFGQTHPYLNEPLRSYIREFYFEAVNDGDAIKAFHDLEIRVGHEKLQEILHNIEICSRHEANYEDIIKDNRLSLNEYLGVREEKKAILNNGRLEILLLLGASGICLAIFDGLVADMKGVLLGTLGGNVLLGFCGLLLFYSMWVMFTMERR